MKVHMYMLHSYSFTAVCKQLTLATGHRVQIVLAALKISRNQNKYNYVLYKRTCTFMTLAALIMNNV